MVTYEDCLAFAELTPVEVGHIAAQEHLPWIVALELGNYLSATVEGKQRLRRILGDDTGAAHARGDRPGGAISAAIPAQNPTPEAKQLAA